MADGSNPGWELRKSSKEHRGEYFFNKFSKETVWVKEWDVEKRGPPPDTGPPLPSQRISHSGSDSAGPSDRSGSSKRVNTTPCLPPHAGLSPALLLALF